MQNKIISMNYIPGKLLKILPGFLYLWTIYDIFILYIIIYINYDKLEKVIDIIFVIRYSKFGYIKN